MRFELYRFRESKSKVLRCLVTLRFQPWKQTLRIASIECMHLGLRKMPKMFGQVVRVLIHHPRFAIAALLVVALGSALATVVFSVLDAVILKPLPYFESQRLVAISELTIRPGGQVLGGLSLPRAELFRGSHRLAGLCWAASGQYALKRGVEPATRVSAGVITEDCLNILGASLVRGRTFQGEDFTGLRGQVAILSYRAWTGLFGAGLSVVGQLITLDGVSYQVVGVLAPNFRLPEQLGQTGADIYLPAHFEEDEKASTVMRLQGWFARLLPTMDIAQTQAALEGLTEFAPGGKSRVEVKPLSEELTKNAGSLLWLLFGGTGLVLLICVGNLVNLVFVHNLRRQREIAMRAALGASRLSLIRLFLIEGAVLAMAGGGLGLALTAWALTVFSNQPPVQAMYRMATAQINARACIFFVVVVTLTAFLSTLGPAWRASRSSDYTYLRASGLLAASKPLTWWRNVLVMAQISLTCVLLVGALLLVESFNKIVGQNLWDHPENVLIIDLPLPELTYSDPARKLALFDNLKMQIMTLPGARAAAYSNRLPMTGRGLGALIETGQSRITNPRRSDQFTGLQIVSAGYIEVLGIPLLRGRSFASGDRSSSMPVVIVNEAFQRRYFPATDAVGQQIRRFGPNEPWREIVGVIADTPIETQGQVVGPQTLLPVTQANPAAQSAISEFMVRTISRQVSVAPALRETLVRLDPGIAAGQIRSMKDLIDETTFRPRAQMVLMSTLATVALALAVIGLYGVVSFAVASRRPEFAVRMAVGATPLSIVLMVLYATWKMVLAGIILGLMGAYSLSATLRSLLFGVTETDPVAYVLVTLLLSIVSMAAAYMPTYRVVKNDLLASIKSE